MTKPTENELFKKFISGYGFALDNQELEIARETWNARAELANKEKAELQAQINELREALEKIALITHETKTVLIISQALAKTAPQCLIQHDNEVLERAAEIAENEYINYKLTEEAHYRHSSLPFLPSNFCFNMEIVHKSKNDAEAIRALKG